MTAAPLGLPPPSLSTDGALRVTCIKPQKLFRISKHATGEPYFGRSGSNRFDAPGCLASTPEFGACYLGLSLDVAIAESLLHDEIPVDGKFQISVAALAQQHVHRFNGPPLRVLDLTGATLKRWSGHADLAGTVSYTITQQWSLAIFNNPLKFDGFLYMSRHLNTDQAAILFDRAAPRLRRRSVPQPLIATKGFAAVAHRFNIVAV